MATWQESKPLSSSQLIGLRKKWYDAELLFFNHVIRGSPKDGIDNSFMTRVALLELREFLNVVLKE